MGCRFCFEFKCLEGKKIGRFQSSSGVEYIVNFQTRNVNYRDIEIRIASDVKFDAVVTIELFQLNTQSMQANSSSKDTVSDHELTAIFQNFRYSSGICVISVITLLEMQNSQSYSSPAQLDNILIPAKKVTVIEKKLDQLSADMKTLLLKNDLADVILSDGSTDIPAHKIILSVRSPVFKTMFQHSMKEKLENRVIITDISVDVLKELLSYIYTGIVCIKEGGMARNLYVAADKYDIQDLKNVCSVYLKDVNLDSVLDTLILASLYGDKTLKQSAMDFIAKNFSQVLRTRTFHKLNRAGKNL